MTVAEQQARGISPQAQVICHRDGTLTYWSVMRQVWVARSQHISDEDLAAIPHAERQRVIAHLDTHR